MITGAAFAAPLWSQNRSFETAAVTQVNEALPGAYAVVLGDVNRDGRADVLVSTASGLFLLEGGAFPQQKLARRVWPANPPVDPASLNLLCDLALADFDRDGALDLAAACAVRSELVILKGAVDGTFRENIRYALKSGAEISRRSVGVVAADLNGDGRIDVAASQESSVAVFVGKGDVTFQPAGEFSVGNLPSGLVAGDFNADGTTDLATSNRFSNDISILLGNGQGGLQPQTRIPINDRPYAFAMGDFNKDGTTDFAVTASESVLLLMGRGDGSFSIGARIQHSEFAVSIATADLNGDGASDLLLGNYYGGVTLLLSQADGTLREAGTVPTLGDVFSVAVGDVSGDAGPDVVASSYSSSTLLIAPVKTTGEFGDPLYFGGAETGIIRLHRVDRKELAKPALLAVTPLKKAVGILPRAAGPVSLIALEDYPLEAYASADFTGDGNADLVVLTVSHLTVAVGEDFGVVLQVLPGRTDGTYGPPSKTPVEGTLAREDSPGLPGFAVGDFTGDGLPDVVLMNSLAGSIQVYPGTRGGVLGPAVAVAEFRGAVTATEGGWAVADFDGNQVQDLAILHLPREGTQYAVHVYLMGQGAQLRGMSTVTPCPTPREVLTGDFGGDGRPDLLVRCRPVYPASQHSVYVLENSGDGPFRQRPAVNLLFGPREVLMAAGDFDGTSAEDIAVVQSEEGGNRLGQVLSTQGDGSFRPVATLSGLSSPVAVIAGRWDDDDRPDIAVLSGTEGTVTVFRNRLGTGAPPPLAVVSAASLREGPLAPNLIASAFGEGLSDTVAVAGEGGLPVNLGGTLVQIRDAGDRLLAASLFFVSPRQINLLVPNGTQVGTALVRVIRGNQPVAEGIVWIDWAAPALFTANADGKGAPAALTLRVRGDGSRSTEPAFQCGAAAGSCAPKPIDVDPASGEVYLLLFGTGISGCASDATVQLGATTLPALSAGPQGEFAGLDQVNVQLPARLAGTGVTDLTLQLSCGQSANPVSIHIR